MRARLLVWVLVAACRSSVDPDTGRFSCATADDCGTGWECRPQFAGGGRCYKAGACKDTETCDGVDENCDGRIDEAFPEQDAGCATGIPGLCETGATGCQAGSLVCGQTVLPAIERCNGLDDNCNGTSDETFDLTSDSSNCGVCAKVCLSGTTCKTSLCAETTCDDGIDNDSNGLSDCQDPSCFGFECMLSVPPSGKCGAVRSDAGADDAGVDDAGVDAGADAGVVDAGVVRGCFRPEQACDNGLDDDGDGLTDCLDPDCDTRTCFSGTQCTNRMCPGPG